MFLVPLKELHSPFWVSNSQISDNTEDITKKKTGRYFELKPTFVGPPSLSFGGYLGMVEVEAEQ